MTVTILHNPRCSKSRQTLSLLKDKGVEPEIVDYLETPPSADELKEILMQIAVYCGVPMGMEVFRIARRVFDEQQ